MCPGSFLSADQDPQNVALRFPTQFVVAVDGQPHVGVATMRPSGEEAAGRPRTHRRRLS
jgi:hypothetical protein